MGGTADGFMTSRRGGGGGGIVEAQGGGGGVQTPASRSTDGGSQAATADPEISRSLHSRRAGIRAAPVRHGSGVCFPRGGRSGALSVGERRGRGGCLGRSARRGTGPGGDE